VNTSSEQPIFVEDGDNIYFPKNGMCFHKSFSEKYNGMTYIQARTTLRKYYTHGQQDSIIHYLKKSGVVKAPIKNYATIQA
jgi:hypothetical protein